MKRHRDFGGRREHEAARLSITVVRDCVSINSETARWQIVAR